MVALRHVREVAEFGKGAGCVGDELLTRFVEHETAGVEISKRQAKEIKKRIEGRPLLDMAEMVADEITEAVVRFPGVRRYRK